MKDQLRYKANNYKPNPFTNFSMQQKDTQPKYLAQEKIEKKEHHTTQHIHIIKSEEYGQGSILVIFFFVFSSYYYYYYFLIFSSNGDLVFVLEIWLWLWLADLRLFWFEICL